jgi:hypothetical protein
MSLMLWSSRRQFYALCAVTALLIGYPVMRSFFGIDPVALLIAALR